MRKKGVFESLLGQKFGKLTAVEFVGKNKYRRSLWRCICDCENKTETIVDCRSLKSSNTTSCGCYGGRFKHGQSNSNNGHKTSVYSCWMAMIQRCTNSSNGAWDDYGGRGITVCNRWLESFENFFADMGEKPSPKHSIDRFPNNNGNYEPTNCRWATQSEQNRNCRSNVLLTFNGETHCMAEWSEILGIARHVIDNRLSRGWTIERVFITPVMEKRKHG